MNQQVSARDGALQQAATHTAQARENLNAQLNTFESQALALAASWCGQGSVGFNQVLARWRAQTQKIVHTLGTFETTLRNTERSFETMDLDTRSTFNRFDALLG